MGSPADFGAIVGRERGLTGLCKRDFSLWG